MDFNQIQELIRLVGKTKLSEFILKEGDFKLVIRNQNGQEGATSGAAPIQPVVTMTPYVAPPAQAPAPAVKLDAPALAPVEKAPAPAPIASVEGANWVAIKSPMVGTFYRSASPDKPPFIKLDSKVEVGSTVCMIEAMKLFNEIESEVKGRIVKILVEDGKPVEYDQALFMVDPS